jgi:hypothetical protein
MKKSILALGLLCAISTPVTTQCGLLDNALAYVKNNGMDLLKKGGQYLWDNKDKIFDTVKENAGPLFDKAKNLLFGEAKKEADKGAVVIVEKAQEAIAKNPGLTSQEQQVVMQEAQKIATQNRAELEKKASEIIEQKRAELKSSVYAKYGKGTPIKPAQ